MSETSSKAFEPQEIEIGKKVVAYKAYVAIYQNCGRGHVAIAAPSLAELRARWEQLANCDFDEALAQHVFICSAAVAKESQ